MRQYIYNLATDKYKGLIPALFKFFLFLFSLIYGLIIRFLIFFSLPFRRKLDCRVISVGNITLGGTGKSTIVEYIARFLKEHGHKVAILSRGYGKLGTKNSKLGSAYSAMGDEPYMLSKKLQDIPVIVDPCRVRAAKKAIRDHSVDTVILDDGFQQWKIKKDMEIVAVDATNPFGNRHMIPRGILREPISSLRRADIFVLTKGNLSKDVERISEYLSMLDPQSLIAESIHKPLGFYDLHHPKETSDIYSLEGKTVTLLSGIGDPDSFENLIKILGIKVGLCFRFRDHHNYSNGDLKDIIEGSRSKNLDTIITTEKDAARLSDFVHPITDIRFLVLRIGLAITKKEEEFRGRLLKLYSL